MRCKGWTCIVLTGFIVFGISAAAPTLAAAQAPCTKWDLHWNARHGSFNLWFTLQQDGTRVWGRASVSGFDLAGRKYINEGDVQGTFTNDSLKLETSWGGVYLGRIQNSTGKLAGTTFDKFNPNRRANWVVVNQKPLTCLARAEPSSPRQVAFCQNYANQAVATAGEYQSLKCGGAEPRWSTDKSLHLDWCIGLRGNRALPNKEAAARQSGLAACKSRMGEIRAKAPIDKVVVNTGKLQSPAPNQAPPHPVTCKSGFVWRVARADDLVCVTPESRARVAQENHTAHSRIQPGGGAYGPNTCKSGFVWREAFVGDLVCVTPEVRTLVREENRVGPSRRTQQ